MTAIIFEIPTEEVHFKSVLLFFQFRNILPLQCIHFSTLKYKMLICP